jgi:serine/threonine protein kinase/tetratricopeptide (TPR) repeat protein
MDLNLSRFQEALAGRYSILREIGSGGMATVYLAEDSKHNRKVVIKVFGRGIAETVAAERFLREIRTAANLAHPHILPLHDSGEAAGLLYFVMPFVKGESLRDRLEREKQLPVEDAVRFTREIADALAYAHSEGVIHRDVKPANILFESGHAVLADFGVAQAVAGAESEETRLTTAGVSLGTPAYMSPEQGTGELSIDGRSDQYSLACVLFEMLTGEAPFRAPSARAVIAKHVTEAPPTLRSARKSTPDGVERAILRSLKKAPADRFPSVQEFSEALLTGLDTQPPEDGTRHPRQPLGWLRPLIVRGAVAAGSLLAVLWLTGPPPADPTIGPQENHVAILYFETFEEEEEGLVRFSRQLTDELIGEFTHLQDISPLRVFSSGAVRESRTRLRPGLEIARDLRAEYLVDGSVIRSGDSIVVQFSLEDPWAGTSISDGEVRESASGAWELPLIQEVAGRLVEHLRPVLGAEIRERGINLGTQDPLAYQKLLGAQDQFSYAKGLLYGTTEGDVLLEFDRTIRLFEEVALQDPNWSEPYVCIGKVAEEKAVFLAEFSDPNDPAGAVEAVNEGLKSLERALAIDPGNPRALAQKGELHYWRGTNTSDPEEARRALAEAESSLRSAIAGDRTLATAMGRLSRIHLKRGEYELAKRRALEALDADAYLESATSLTGNLAVALLNVGDEEEALARCREVQDASSSYPGFECELEVMAWGRKSAVDPAAAQALVDTILQLGGMERQPSFRPRVLFALAGVFGRAGMADSARAKIQEARESRPENLPLWQEAAAELQAGNRSGAIVALERLLKGDPARGPAELNKSLFSVLSDDPRFLALRARFGGT